MHKAKWQSICEAHLAYSLREVRCFDDLTPDERAIFGNQRDLERAQHLLRLKGLLPGKEVQS